MADDPINAHITACSPRSEAELTARMLEACWPGGADRSQPGALSWLSRWRPGRSEATLPACTCPAGHCPVCN